MNGSKLAAFVLIVAGVLALAYGGFSYTKDTHTIDAGPIHLAVAEKETVNIPIWAGAASLGIGIFLLLSRARS